MVGAWLLAAALVCGATASMDKKGCKTVLEEVESCTVEPKEFCTPANCKPGVHVVCEMVEESHGSYRRRREADDDQPAGRRRREVEDSGRKRRQALELDASEVRREYEAEVAGDILLPSEEELREILARPTESAEEDEEDEEDEDKMLDAMLDDVFKETDDENMVKKEGLATEVEDDLSADYGGEQDYDDYTEAPMDYDDYVAPTDAEAPLGGLEVEADVGEADYGDYGGDFVGGEDESSSEDYESGLGGAPTSDTYMATPSTPSPSYTAPPSYTTPSPSYTTPSPSYTAPSSFDSAVPLLQPYYSPPSGQYGFVPEPVAKEPTAVEHHGPAVEYAPERNPVDYGDYEPAPAAHPSPAPAAHHSPAPVAHHSPAPVMVKKCREVASGCTCRMGTREVCSKKVVQVKKCPKSQSAHLVTKLLSKIGAGINKHLEKARPWVSGLTKLTKTKKPKKVVVEKPRKTGRDWW